MSLGFSSAVPLILNMLGNYMEISIFKEQFDQARVLKRCTPCVTLSSVDLWLCWQELMASHPCFMPLGLKIIWHVPNQGAIKCLILDCCQQCLSRHKHWFFKCFLRPRTVSNFTILTISSHSVKKRKIVYKVVTEIALKSEINEDYFITRWMNSFLKKTMK